MVLLDAALHLVYESSYRCHYAHRHLARHDSSRSWSPHGADRAALSSKNGMPSVHPLTGIELRALRRLQREQKPGRYVFMSERGAPMSAVAFRRMLTRLGPAAKMPFGIHPHMLRHSTGFKLANQGVDTRSLQHYLGHKNIQHTVRYSEFSPDRFRDFWKD